MVIRVTLRKESDFVHMVHKRLVIYWHCNTSLLVDLKVKIIECITEDIQQMNQPIYPTAGSIH